MTERRLAAILSADVVGYSRLMSEDEDATVAGLGRARASVGQLVPEHHGRLVDFTGDNFLAEFPSALDGARCAVALQQEFVEAGTLRFRIGVHLGDVRVEGDRIYGDGVNIAARLEGLAEAGGICISSAVYDQVRRKLELVFEDLGEQSIKNLPDPVRVFRLPVAADGEAATAPTSTGGPALPAPAAPGAVAAPPRIQPQIVTVPASRLPAVRAASPALDVIADDSPLTQESFRGIFSSHQRAGRWEPADQIQVLAFCGEVTLDFRRAVLPPSGMIEIDALSICGQVTIIVPDGAEIELEAKPFMGSVEQQVRKKGPRERIREWVTGDRDDDLLGSIERHVRRIVTPERAKEEREEAPLAPAPPQEAPYFRIDGRAIMASINVRGR